MRTLKDLQVTLPFSMNPCWVLSVSDSMFLYIFVLYKLFYTLSNDTNCFFPNRIIVYSLTSYASLPLKPTIRLLSAMATIIFSLLVNSGKQCTWCHCRALSYVLSSVGGLSCDHGTFYCHGHCHVENQSSDPPANEQPGVYRNSYNTDQYYTNWYR